MVIHDFMPTNVRLHRIRPTDTEIGHGGRNIRTKVWYNWWENIWRCSKLTWNIGTLRFLIFLTNNLTILTEVTNYLQTSPGSGSYFFSRIGEINQMHTHKGTSEKLLFLHKNPCVKSTTPSLPLLHQGNATEKYQCNNKCLLYTNIFTNKWCKFILKLLRHVSTLIHHLQEFKIC